MHLVPNRIFLRVELARGGLHRYLVTGSATVVSRSSQHLEHPNTNRKTNHYMDRVMNHKSVCILDYGSGNALSVFNILTYLGYDTKLSNSPDDLKESSHIVLPGVGAFGASMEKINNRIPLDVLEEEVLQNKKPFLGICVGMQVLADTGKEFGEHQGLGWIPGSVEILDSKDLPLPHIGWNNIEIKQSSVLLENLKDYRDFYFLHSYTFHPKDEENVIAQTEYGSTFNCLIGKDNIFGIQFHPEKSQKAGQLVLKNFMERV